MSELSIGQLVSNATSEGYVEKLGNKLNITTQTYDIFGIKIKDAAIKIDSGYFEEINYLIKFTVKNTFNENFSYKIKLVEEGYHPYTPDTQYLSQNLTEEARVVEKNTTDTVSIIFRPNVKEKYTKIILELDRSGIGNPSDYETKIESVISVTSASLYQIINKIPPRVDIKEIGIQGDPGLQFEINGEAFKLGKTGLFYLREEDFIFESIGFNATANSNFILDYKYKEV